MIDKMAVMKESSTLWLLLLSLLLSAHASPAQEPIKDHSQARPDSTLTKEIFLEDIHIEAMVEKPGVTLIPKRVEAEIATVPFTFRSFDEELRAKPGMIEENGKEVEKSTRAKKIKNSLLNKGK